MPAAQDLSPESAAIASDLMACFMASYDALDAETRVVLALAYHAERSFEVIAKKLRTEEQTVKKLHDQAVLAIHDAPAGCGVTIADASGGR